MQAAELEIALHRRDAESYHVDLRVRLFIGPSAPELHSLRWETLLDPAAEHDNIVSGEEQDSELTDLSLPEPGCYYIEAGRCCPEDDQGSEGEYILELWVAEE